MSKESIAFWAADHLRISLFCKQPVWEISIEDVFQAIFGAAPDETTKRSAELIASANLDTYRAELKRTFNRLDCVIQPLPSGVPEFQVLENIEHLLNPFVDQVVKWAGTQPEGVVRIAIGLGGLLRVDDVKSGYVKLKELVRTVAVDVDRFRDFQFRVNLPQQSEFVERMMLNRLTTWSVVQFHSLPFSPTTPIPLPATNKFYCACAVDVNTDADNTELMTSSQLEKLFAEMKAEVVKLLTDGVE